MPRKRRVASPNAAPPLKTGDVSVRPNWLTTVPEISSPQEIHERRAWMEAIYSDEVVRKIAGTGRLGDSTDLKALRGFLVDVGLWFDDHKDVRNPSASYAAEREQLKTIVTQAKKLETALAGVTNDTAELLWRPFAHMMLRLHPDAPSHIIPELGLTVMRRQHADGAFEMQHLRPPQIMEAVTVIRKTAELAASILPSQKGGNRQFDALVNWTNSAFHFWARHSTIAFDPRTSAFDFCLTAFRLIEPGVSEPQIRTAMRTVKKRQQALKTRMASVAQKSK